MGSSREGTTGVRAASVSIPVHTWKTRAQLLVLTFERIFSEYISDRNKHRGC